MRVTTFARPPPPAPLARAWLLVTWHDVCLNEQDVAKQLRDQQMVMKGHRDDALVHVSWAWSGVGVMFLRLRDVGRVNRKSSCEHFFFCVAVIPI